MILTRTISVPEVVWTLVALFALIYVSRLTRRAVENLAYLKKNKLNHLREAAARISIMIFGTFFMLVTMNLVTGLVAMLIPTANASRVHPFTYVVTTIFILEAIFIAAMCYIIDRAQVRLVEKAIEMERSANASR